MNIDKKCKKAAVCPMCDGDGIIECTKCDGAGEISNSALLGLASACSKCEASGKINCPDFEEES